MSQSTEFFPYAVADIIDRSLAFEGRKLSPTDARHLLHDFTDDHLHSIHEALRGVLAAVEHEQHRRRRLGWRRTALSVLAAAFLAISATGASAAPTAAGNPSVPTGTMKSLPLGEADAEACRIKFQSLKC